jgi:hypothetical protein
MWNRLPLFIVIHGDEKDMVPLDSFSVSHSLAILCTILLHASTIPFCTLDRVITSSLTWTYHLKTAIVYIILISSVFMGCFAFFKQLTFLE